MKQILTPRQKALEINLNPKIYGTFVEIGAGQETVRHFYRAGGASGTVAKSMSAYDKAVSDAIYGIEQDGRYVTEERLNKMLTHELDIIEERLTRKDYPNKTFFTFANTVTTIDFAKKYKGHGWFGIRFQLEETEEYNDIILHLRFKENDVSSQQETIGIIGVNLVYGAFYYSDNPRILLQSLYDNLHKDQVEIDMINFHGTRFVYVDNRLMSLQLVKNGMTDAVIFGPDQKNILPARLLYKKNIFAIRGSFRPVTKLNIDMLESGLSMFKAEENVVEENIQVLFEITLSNLLAEGEIDEKDFLDRADILGKLGHVVIISNFSEYYKLVDYFSNYSKNRMGIVMGVNNLLDVFIEDYYKHLSGGIMEAFGKLFTKDLRVYLYPFNKKPENIILDSENLKVDNSLKELYKYFKQNKRIVDIKNFQKDSLQIYSREILKQINAGEEDCWENKLPEGVANLIKQRKMFGYGKVYKFN